MSEPTDQPDDLTGYCPPEPPIGCILPGADNPATSGDTPDSPLRELIETALRASWDSGVNVHRDEAIRRDADAVVAAILPTTRLLGALHRSAHEDVTRVIDLYERWCAAGPPPIGRSLSRWWDERLVELHDTILPPAPAAAHDGGPSVADCAADDAKHWPERQWGGE